jgi:hypothetical protein
MVPSPRPTWADVQIDARDLSWPEVERVLSALPPDMFRQAKLLEYDLALRYADSGQFRDIFTGPNHFPILSIVRWLLDDLGVEPSAARDDAERHLFVLALLLVARGHVIERMADEDSFYGQEHAALVQFCSERSIEEFGHVFPPGAAFWSDREAVALNAMERAIERGRGSTGDHADPELLLGGWLSAAAAQLALAAGAYAGRDDLRDRIAALLDNLAAAFQITTELASMHRDLQRRRRTYPIAVVARAHGIDLRPQPMPEAILGALVLTDSLATILDARQDRFEASRQAASDLGLPTFSAFVDDVLESIDDARAAQSKDGGRRRPLIERSEPTASKALAMAEAFLLADPTLSESWETHREGLFAAPMVVSRFPAGLVLEILCENGHELPRAIDEFMEFTAGNGFRYYDHPASDVDTDTIGVVLRLRQFETWAGLAPALDPVLACLDRVVSSNGTVPVWLPDCRSDETRPAVIALGEGCGTVAAQLLLGLANVEDEHRETVETGSSDLFRRIADVGLRANVNYPPLYALSIFFRVIERLGSRAAQPAARARRALEIALDEAIAIRPPTPQQAGLLARACLDAGRPDLLDARWSATILKGQRFDGSWDREPFAAAPNRGKSVTWYSSATLTTALCYDALWKSSRVASEGDDRSTVNRAVEIRGERSLMRA